MSAIRQKRWPVLLMAALLTLFLLPTAASAAEPPSLTVDGVDALTTSSGEGWSYDSAQNTLTLDGYNGGSIVASYMDLKVVLAKGSANCISTAEEYGIATVQDPFDGPYFSLQIEGGEGSSLSITAANHAIFAYGSISMDNCNLTAENTTSSAVTGEMECISSHSTISISGSTLAVTTNGVGITCYDEQTITGSNITVDAGVIGIHANNENLYITDTVLDVVGKTAALYSYFGTIHLTGCSGELEAGTAAIYAQNLNGDSDTELTDCNLTLTAPYGVMSYSGVQIQNGELTLNGGTGIYAYSTSYDADTAVTGTAKVDGTGCDRAFLVYGDYSCQDTAVVNGVVHQNQGDAATEKIILSGDVAISQDTAYSKAVVISQGARVTVEPGVTFDLSGAPSVTNAGTLTNKGTLILNGASTDNQGTIWNYSGITLADGQSIVNSGTIYSACTSDFDLSPYGASGIVFHAGLVKQEAKDPTYTEDGNIAYWHCAGCGRYFLDEEGKVETTLADTVIPKLKDRIPTPGTSEDTGTASDGGQSGSQPGGKPIPETGGSGLSGWASLFGVSVIALAGAYAGGRKRK